jgi:hypothetical protein
MRAVLACTVLHAVRHQDDQSTKDEMGNACSTDRGKMNKYRNSEGKLEGKGPLRKPGPGEGEINIDVGREAEFSRQRIWTGDGVLCG